MGNHSMRPTTVDYRDGGRASMMRLRRQVQFLTPQGSERTLATYTSGRCSVNVEGVMMFVFVDFFDTALSFSH